ncbi:hypothetical protein PILCRDRAFT_565401 [Piloderma croceum F 1598]|uniref:DUF6534 domain-containing protein n=1 Tax=Piloderma croceum (strain F 1598) TaxID=765440 RepID=A0A0C3F3K3_PILCF|nr:hypothetical protein PILCRDRAFT_565401 [Piloderma croceum F 1598]
MERSMGILSFTMTVTVGNTWGSIYLGVVFAAIFFGITSVQSYNYYLRYPQDWRVYKISVGALWILDIVHLALSTHIGYHYLIIDFGNLLAFTTVVWSQKAQITVHVLIIMIVQSLYALRVWKLGAGYNERLVPLVVTLSVLAVSVVGIILSVLAWRNKSFLTIYQISWAIDTSFAMSTASDIAIAVAMIYYLLKSRTSFASTNSKLASLIQYSIGAGVATSACSLSALIAYLVMPDNLIFLAIEFSLTKLYVNSLLAM